MPEQPNEPEEQVSKKVVYEHVTTSGSSRQNLVVIIVIAVIALALVAYIFVHLR